MLGWRGGHSPKPAFLKVGYLLHAHPQLLHTSLVEMVTQRPDTLLGWGSSWAWD